jgi:hypothetical protein
VTHWDKAAAYVEILESLKRSMIRDDPAFESYYSKAGRSQTAPTLPREPVERDQTLSRTELHGWHCTEPGPDLWRSTDRLSIPVLMGAASPWVASVPEAFSMRRDFHRAWPGSPIFIEDGVPTFDGVTGKIVECPCPSCTYGATRPGLALESHKKRLDRPTRKGES